MAEKLITFLVALPLLYGAGQAFIRLGGGLWRAVRRASPAASPAAVVIDLPLDGRYDVALATARATLHLIETRPDMQGHEKLAGVTYAILEGMHRVEELRQAVACPEPSVN